MLVGELPSHLAQTLFSKPAEYPIAMRYSTEIGEPGMDDRIPQPRGLGMKVFNVEGTCSMLAMTFQPRTLNLTALLL